MNIYVDDTDGDSVGRDFPGLTDMSTVNETGKQAGRYIYSTQLAYVEISE